MTEYDSRILRLSELSNRAHERTFELIRQIGTSAEIIFSHRQAGNNLGIQNEAKAIAPHMKSYSRDILNIEPQISNIASEIQALQADVKAHQDVDALRGSASQARDNFQATINSYEEARSVAMAVSSDEDLAAIDWQEVIQATSTIINSSAKVVRLMDDLVG